MIGSIQSTLRMEFRHDADRDRTVLHRRRAGGLAHISKPYWNGEVLTVQMVNPTAGIFTGDEMSSQIHVGADARVALTAPSAMRFHTMRTGRATIAQDFRIEDRAWLEFLPEWVIPQRDSDVEQTTRIRLGQSSQLAFFDLLAPGRVAHGECYAYRRYVTTLELHRENQLVVRERMVLSPNDGGWPLRVPGWENCYYGAAWFVGGEGGACMTVLEEVERALQAGDLKCGVSELGEGVVVVRMVASRSLTLRKALTAVRTAMAEVFPLLASHHRKI